MLRNMLILRFLVSVAIFCVSTSARKTSVFLNLSWGFAHRSASNLSPALERLLNSFVCLPGYSVRELFGLSQFKHNHQCTYLDCVVWNPTSHCGLEKAGQSNQTTQRSKRFINIPKWFALISHRWLTSLC